jgi:hypothetical protein
MLSREVVLAKSQDAPASRVSKDLARWCVTEPKEMLEESGGRLQQAIWRDARPTLSGCPRVPQTVSIYHDVLRDRPSRRQHTALNAARLRVRELSQQIEASHIHIILNAVIF